jgi:hypothetical protein
MRRCGPCQGRRGNSEGACAGYSRDPTATIPVGAGAFEVAVDPAAGTI